MEAREMQFLHSNHYRNCKAVVDKHFSGYCSIQLMSQGGVELYYGDRKHELSGRWYWAAFPGPRIRFHLLPPFSWWEHRYVAFQGPLVADLMKAGLIPETPIPALGDDDEAKFDRLLDAVEREGVWAHRKAVNLLENLLIELSESQYAGKTYDEWLMVVLNELNRISGHPQEYKRIATNIGISLPTLRKRFRRAMGVPLHTYVLNLRLVRARELLAETTVPIKEVAGRLGYGDVQFFGRQFKKFVGVSPASYRQSGQITGSLDTLGYSEMDRK